MAKIEVTISGPAGCGKSAIAWLIQVALNARGLGASYQDKAHARVEENTDGYRFDVFENQKPSIVLVEKIERPGVKPINYDPNLFRKFHKKTVKLIFGLWEYRLETTVVATGNIMGADLITFAVEKAYAGLETNAWGSPKLIMTDAAGDTLLVEQDNDDADGEDWLKKMLVAAEIVSIEAEKAGEA